MQAANRHVGPNYGYSGSSVADLNERALRKWYSYATTCETILARSLRDFP